MTKKQWSSLVADLADIINGFDETIISYNVLYKGEWLVLSLALKRNDCLIAHDQHKGENVKINHEYFKDIGLKEAKKYFFAKTTNLFQ